MKPNRQTDRQTGGRVCRRGPRSDLLYLGNEVVTESVEFVIVFCLKEERPPSISQC